jgi:hypothetical protein
MQGLTSQAETAKAKPQPRRKDDEIEKIMKVPC